MYMTTKDEASVKEAIGGEGKPIRVLNYIGATGSLGDGGPQGFMVCMNANSTGKPHFHPADQFQVFFGTEGSTFGRKPVARVFLHYTDGYTPYGPFASGPSGMNFFTLRAEASLGTFWMPESRDKMVRKAGRSVHVSVPDTDKSPGKALCTTLAERQADGLAAYVVSGGPGGRITGPSPAGSKGQYYIVTSGSMQCQGKRLPFQSVLFVKPDEPAPVVGTDEAGGFEAVVLQYPLARGAA